MCQKANIENVYTAELLLTGILRQEIDLEQYPFTTVYDDRQMSFADWRSFCKYYRWHLISAAGSSLQKLV